MMSRISLHLLIGSLLLPFPGSAQPADPAPTNNLVDVLRTAMAVPDKSAPAGTSKEDKHLLAPGDVIQLSIYQEEDLNLPRAPITKDGTISHPLLGLVPIGGKSLDEAKAMILEMLKKDYLVDPRLSLTILEYSKNKITVLGQVVRPGTYEVPSNEPLSLIQAIVLAGGPTRLGSLSKITVQRVVDSKKTEIRLDTDKKEDKAFPVKGDDVIEIGERNF